MIKHGDLFENIGNLGKDGEFFEDLYRYQNVRIERIVSRGQVSPKSGYYDQDWMEIVLVIQGMARLDVEDEECVLKAGDWRVLEPHVRHRVTYTSEEPACVWLAIHVE